MESPVALAVSVRPSLVRKRDGVTTQLFDSFKIESAVRKAWETIEPVDEVLLGKISAYVTNSLPIGEVADVETIQDAVEFALMDFDKKAIAKAYILYRDNKTKIRLDRLCPDPDAIADYMHPAKYGKFIEEINRRELFDETTDRVMMMHIRRFPQLRRELLKAFEMVAEKRLLPSLRSFQFAGEAIEKTNARIYNCSFSLIDRIEVFSEILYLLLCGCGVGYSVQSQHVDMLPPMAIVDELKVEWHHVADSIEGWADAARALFDGHVRGVYVDFDYSAIRPAGSLLKTSGGRAPGHLGLKRALEKVRAILTSAGGRKLKPIEAYDCNCHLADAVLSGGIRRCLPAGSLVHSTRGLVKIEDIAVGDLVKTSNSWNRVIEVISQGKQKLMSINTQMGTFECTPNHRMAVLTSPNSYEFKRADELEQSDRLVFVDHVVEGVKTNLPTWSYERSAKDHTSVDITIPELSESIAWGIGYIHGNGHVNVNRTSDTGGSHVVSVSMCDSDAGTPERINRMHKFFKSFGVNSSDCKINNENTRRISAAGKQLALYFESIKRSKTSINVPDFILEGTASIKASYLAGLFDSDGGAGNRPVLLVASVYYNFLVQVQAVYSSLGIPTRLKLNRKQTGNWQNLYHLNLVGEIPNSRFKSRIEPYAVKFITERKQSQFDYGYPGSWIIGSGLNYSHIWSSNTKQMTIGTFDRCGGSRNDLIPIEVLSVDDDNIEADTYDISVENQHEFVVNGLLVHNSATLCLFSVDDTEMMTAKTGSWYETHPWRQNSNNSAMLIRDKVTKEQFGRLFKSTKEQGEPGFIFSNHEDTGFNPCFIPDTRISTDRGIIKIIDLANNSSMANVISDTRVGKLDNLDSDLFGTITVPAKNIEIKQRNVPVSKVTLEHGYSVVTTLDHDFITTNGRRPLASLAVGDTLMLSSGCGRFGTSGTYNDGLLLGLFVSDGVKTDTEAFIDIWKADFGETNAIFNAMNLVVSNVDSVINRDYGEVHWRESNPVKKRIGGMRFFRHLKSLADSGDVSSLKLRVPESVWSGSEEMVRGYLHGLFYGDGSVNVSGHSASPTVSLRLNQSNLKLLEDVQVLLIQFSVISRIYSRRAAGPRMMPNGIGGQSEYMCLENFEVIINRPNLITFIKNVGMFGRKADLIHNVLARYGTDCRRPETYVSRVVSIEPAGNSDVYCLTQPLTNCVISNGIVNGQCGEILMNPIVYIDESNIEKISSRDPSVKVGDRISGFGFCNLCEINAAKLTSLEDFKEVAWAAAVIGTCQAAYTSFPYLGVASEVIAERDALLGISMTGMMDNPNISCNPEYQQEVARYIVECNREIAGKIGINSSARSTCVKPAGSSSLVFKGVASGHHVHHSRRYFRRVTANPLEPVFKYFQSINPHMCTKKPNGDYVIEFVVEAPPNAIIKEDVSAIEFLEMVKSTQLNWVVPGTSRPDSAYGGSHNVSNTVHVKADEWELVEEYLWNNRNTFAGVSLLPSTGDKIYKNAPFESISTPEDEARWNHIIENYIKVDYSLMVEDDDQTNRQGELACVGGACLI